MKHLKVANQSPGAYLGGCGTPCRSLTLSEHQFTHEEAENLPPRMCVRGLNKIAYVNTTACAWHTTRIQ